MGTINGIARGRQRDYEMMKFCLEGFGDDRQHKEIMKRLKSKGIKKIPAGMGDKDFTSKEMKEISELVQTISGAIYNRPS